MTTKQMLKNMKLTGYYLHWYRDCMIDENKALMLANWEYELVEAEKYIEQMSLDVQAYYAKSWENLWLTKQSATEEVRKMANKFYNELKEN